MIIIVSMWLIPAYHCNSPNLLHIIDIDMLFSSIILVYFHHHLVYTHVKWDFFWGVVSYHPILGVSFFFWCRKISCMESPYWSLWCLHHSLPGALSCRWWQRNAVRSAWACPCLEWDMRIYLDVPLEVRINGVFHLLINGYTVYWGYNPLILTFS